MCFSTPGEQNSSFNGLANLSIKKVKQYRGITVMAIHEILPELARVAHFKF